jgi:hypothetical protein
MSIFNSTLERTTAKPKKHWSFRRPDRRNPAVRSLLSVRSVATVKPPCRGVYAFNGESLDSFDAVKVAARKANFGILRMGAVSINL